MISILMLGMAATAQGGPTPADGAITREQAEARLATCGTRKFQSVAEFEVAGKMKRSRLELCAADSETDAEWIAKLQKAETSVQAQTSIPESARFQLLTDLRAEIDRLKASQSVIAVGTDLSIASKPKAEVVVPKGDFAISALPSMPKARESADTRFDPNSTAKLSTKKPPLSIQCLSLMGLPQRCTDLSVYTVMSVSADANLASPVTLLFRRLDSDNTARVRVAALKSGQTVRFAFPPEICRGVVRAEFDVQVTGPGSDGLRYSDVVGPFEKRC